MSLFVNIIMITIFEITVVKILFFWQLNCKTPENSNFLKNDKIVISVKIQNFSRFRMTKQTSSLKWSREI